MKNRDQFNRELNSRLITGAHKQEQGKDLEKKNVFDPKYVVNLLRYHVDKKDKALCLVMHRADRNLYKTLISEQVAGDDMAKIKYILSSIAECVKHVHEKGVIHRDLNPVTLCLIKQV